MNQQNIVGEGEGQLPKLIISHSKFQVKDNLQQQQGSFTLPQILFGQRSSAQQYMGCELF